jgi:hypothetical protein
MTKLSVPQLTAAFSGGALLLAGVTVSGAVLLSRPSGARTAASPPPAIALAQSGPASAAPAGMGAPAGMALGGAPDAAAPGTPAPPVAASESQLPDLEELSPLEPYRENPFVTRPEAHEEGLVLLPRLGTYVTPADAQIWGSLVRSNQEYFKANLENNFGFHFGWGTTRYPRPRTVLQPAPAEPTTLFPQPPSATITLDGVGVGATAAEGAGPRPGTGAQPTGGVEPRSTTKAETATVRRVAAVVHNGTAIAIIEYEEAGKPKRIQVRAGQEFGLGTVKYRVRSISGTDVILVNLATNAELTVPLRGRTANE